MSKPNQTIITEDDDTPPELCPEVFIERSKDDIDDESCGDMLIEKTKSKD